MTEKDKNDVIDWLNDVVYSPERAYNDYYSESEQQLLAKKALELIKEQLK